MTYRMLADLVHYSFIYCIFHVVICLIIVVAVGDIFISLFL